MLPDVGDNETWSYLAGRGEEPNAACDLRLVLDSIGGDDAEGAELPDARGNIGC